jgi:hypothetical protein
MLLCVTMLCAATLAAQTPQQDQFWPELDYFQSLTAHTRLFVTAQWSLNGIPGQQDEQYGVSFDVMFRRPNFLPHVLGAKALDEDRGETVQLRLGYKWSQTIQTDDPSTTNRLFTEVTTRARIGSVLMADRNGFDWRWVSGGYSTRYRNRVEAQRPVKIDSYQLTPYSNCEWAYVLGRSGWSSVKCEFGAQFPVLPHLTVIPYYGILNVWQSNPLETQAFGLTLAASF